MSIVSSAFNYYLILSAIKYSGWYMTYFATIRNGVVPDT